MSDTVWACDFYNKSEIDSDFQADVAERDTIEVNRTMAQNFKGAALDPSAWPASVYATKAKPRTPKAVANMGFIAVSQSAVDVLSDFDLGACKFHEARFLAKDRETPLDIGHRFIEFGNVKNSFSIEDSPNARPVPSHRSPEMVNYRYPPLVVKDGDLALSRACLDGPDLWVESFLIRMMFVSDRVASALRAAKLDKPFFLRRCRIV